MAPSPNQQSHVVVCPGAGMGHLNPYLRLTSVLSSTTSFKVTLVVIRPSLSDAEAEHIASFSTTHPNVHLSEFYILPCDNDLSLSPNLDPFLLKYWAMCRSACRLVDHLTSLSPPPSAVISDIMLASGLNKALAELSIPNFNLITTSARFFSFMACLPLLEDDETEVFNPIADDDIPGGPVTFNRRVPFLRLMDTNYRCLRLAKGIILNTFDFLETKTIRALGSGVVEVLSDLPQVFPLGPLHTNSAKDGKCNDQAYLTWLDEQPPKSVGYVSFGSRTTISIQQIVEIAEGLEKSGVGFLWVVKTTIVDKEDKEELKSLLGEGFFERTKGRGLVWKGWVRQEDILRHPSIGGFVTHCGWNSVTEAALQGLPMLAWPGHDEQRVNASVVEKAGLGMWDSKWNYSKQVGKGEEIAERMKALLNNERLRDSARRIGEEAKKAWQSDGSANKMFRRLIDTINEHNFARQA